MSDFSCFKENIIPVSVVLYLVFSVLLKLFYGINYLIPCFWKTFFGFECSGCGVSSSVIEIIKGNFQAAWKLNKITFLILPLLLYYSFKEFVLKIN